MNGRSVDRTMTLHLQERKKEKRAAEEVQTAYCIVAFHLGNSVYGT